jgi:hypothetical protein
MSRQAQPNPPANDQPSADRPSAVIRARPVPPISNYTLSTVCPGCGAPTVRRACKVRCDRCGFMWDCSEL